MLKQAEDFYEESKDIHYILKNISEDRLNTRTQFKSWSFTDIIRHLHVWNIAAYTSLKGCLLYTSPSPRDDELSRMPSSA